MKITIDEKIYETDDFELIDSIDKFSWQEFLYFTETLFKTGEGEYVLETSWQLNPQWAQSGIEDGTITQDDLEPKTEYKLMCLEEKEAWLEESVWTV